MRYRLKAEHAPVLAIIIATVQHMSRYMTIDSENLWFDVSFVEKLPPEAQAYFEPVV